MPVSQPESHTDATYSSCSQQRAITACDACSRLRRYCANIAKEKRRSFADSVYWGNPVPNFGRGPVSLLIVGLAPAAHGANRTSRMFTGDRSGEWLYRALHKAGFAASSGYETADDNQLLDCMITSVIHCAPPANKPSPEEILACRPFLVETIREANPRAILCLGGIAWTETFKCLSFAGTKLKAPKFAHGAVCDVTCDIEPAQKNRKVFASYHPSQQNTFTKRLTEPMFDQIFRAIRKSL